MIAPQVVALVCALAALVAAAALGVAGDEAGFRRVNARRLEPAGESALRTLSHLGLMPTNALEWMAVWFLVGRREGVVGVSFMLSAWAVCRGIKALVRRERPHLALTDARLVGLAPSGSSFPSSHVALVLYTALAAPVALGWGPTPALAALLLAGAVAYARVYLGAHYPRDVLAGMVIGATCAGAAMIWL